MVCLVIMAWSAAARQAAILARRRKMKTIKEVWVDRTKKYRYGDCAIASAAVVSRLLARGVKTGYKVINGDVIYQQPGKEPAEEGHTWIEFSGRVIDPTKSQFGEGTKINYNPGRNAPADKKHLYNREEYGPEDFLNAMKRQGNDPSDWESEYFKGRK